MIGDPVRHSLSPAIHNAAFAATGLDWVFVALPVAAGQGGVAVTAMDTFGIDGLSVTMPHKAAVAAALARRTAVAERLGVCNCVFRDEGGLVGDSTDGDGFVRSLKLDEGIDLADARVLIIGTGGAACSIIEAVGRSGPAELLIVSRDPQRAGRAAELASMARPGTLGDVGSVDIVINASPVGMSGGPAPEDSPLPIDLIVDRHTVVDIVYQPRQTPLLRGAALLGAKTVNGVGMLVHQAAIAFQHWTGHPAPLDAMRAAALGSDLPAS